MRDSFSDFVFNPSLLPILLGLPVFLVGIRDTAIVAKYNSENFSEWWKYRATYKYGLDFCYSLIASTVEELSRWARINLFIIFLALVFPALSLPIIFTITVVIVGIINSYSHEPKNIKSALFHFFTGVYFSFLMLTCGVIATMISHFIYDLSLTTVEYFSRID